MKGNHEFDLVLNWGAWPMCNCGNRTTLQALSESPRQLQEVGCTYESFSSLAPSLVGYDHTSLPDWCLAFYVISFLPIWSLGWRRGGGSLKAGVGAIIEVARNYGKVATSFGFSLDRNSRAVVGGSRPDGIAIPFWICLLFSASANLSQFLPD